jgi:CRP-like cAMP-binding protein
MDEAIAKKIDDFFSKYKKQTFKKGEILIRADDDPAGVFYLKEGFVKKYAISKKGEELAINIFKPVSFFPMPWAMNNAPNVYFYEAMTPLTVWRAPKDEVIAFVKREPDVLYDLLSRVYRGTEGMQQRMLYLMSGNAYERLVTEIVIAAKRFGQNNSENGAISVKTTEKDLATSAGMTRETVSREMKNLKDSKLVSFAANSLVIHNLAALEDELSAGV